MPQEGNAEEKAAVQPAAAAKAAEEKRKRENQEAVTKGLIDLTTIKQLSSSGYEAKARRQKFQSVDDRRRLLIRLIFEFGGYHCLGGSLISVREKPELT
ncbi:hypothetical protein BDV28DRAFT_146459 [Aspergillus coremiiformis]|uniref:Uncharacterized protein n=1 Tax=Aspergillus coremiiformis TaxID=138285 RepID=A0A5N6ZD12_9EURO|nr:hypothetical protein BDV28DRAFT_146459 [Aspergillus coremiiformis]